MKKIRGERIITVLFLCILAFCLSSCFPRKNVNDSSEMDLTVSSEKKESEVVPESMTSSQQVEKQVNDTAFSQEMVTTTISQDTISTIEDMTTTQESNEVSTSEAIVPEKLDDKDTTPGYSIDSTQEPHISENDILPTPLETGNEESEMKNQSTEANISTVEESATSREDELPIG